MVTFAFSAHPLRSEAPEKGGAGAPQVALECAETIAMEASRAGYILLDREPNTEPNETVLHSFAHGQLDTAVSNEADRAVMPPPAPRAYRGLAMPSLPPVVSEFGISDLFW